MSRLGSFLGSVLRLQSHVGPQRLNTFKPCLQTMVLMRGMGTDPPEHQPESNEPWIPEYIEKFEEPLEEKRSRLMYQSRKRGMLENGLLLGKVLKY